MTQLKSLKPKRGAAILLIIVVLFFISIIYRNITTYNSMKKNAAYTYGTIIKVWNDDGWYSRYQYTVDGRIYQGRQGEKHGVQDTVLIIYDATAPRFSMIAEYPSPVVLDSGGKIVALDTTLVRFRWWDYLPGDEIHSIKDLWSLE